MHTTSVPGGVMRLQMPVGGEQAALLHEFDRLYRLVVAEGALDGEFAASIPLHPMRPELEARVMGRYYLTLPRLRNTLDDVRDWVRELGLEP